MIRESYDKLGHLKSVKESGGANALASYAYDSMGRVDSITDGNGNVHVYTYDEQGRETNYAVKDSANNIVYTESKEYEEVDADDNSVVTTTVGSGDDSIVTAEYTNKYGEMVKETSGTGSDVSETKYTYDYAGNVVNTITPNASADNKQYTYKNTNTAQNNEGISVKVTDIYNNVTTEKKDMLGRTVKTTDALGNETNTTYDAQGRVFTVSSKIDGGDSVTAYEYDNNGNVTKESVTSNKPGETTAYRNTYYQYDSMNRLIKTNTDEPGETLYEYDLNGNITKMTTGAVNGAGGVSTVYEYDSRNRLTKMTDPMGYTETYTYDNNGNVVTMTDKNGTVTTNTYNAVNNLLNSASVKGTETQTTTYTYGDASGVLLGISDDNSSISYSYNKKGRQTGESRSTGETLTYTYDKDGNQTGMTMNANNGDISQNLSYTYNYLGQMTEVKDNAANEVIATYTYDGNGNIIEKKTNGNSMITEYTYNESGLLKTVENQTIADPLRNIKGTYSKYSYSYYLDGNQSEVTDVFDKAKTYTYDGAGRLKSERYDKESGIDSWVNVYSYDARGNRISKITKKGTSGEIDLLLTNTEVSPASISNIVNIEDSEFKPYIPEAPLPDLTGLADYSVCTYVYNERNELISSNWYDNGYMNRITDYSYDSNGNMIYKKVKQYFDNYAPEDATVIEYPDEYTYYNYNVFNQLTKVKRNNVETTYVYDPQNERTGKTVDGISTNYVWDDAGNIVMEYGTQGEKIYNRGVGGEIISDGENYFAYNGHGDTTNLVRQSSDTAVEITAAYEYDAFGNNLALGGEATDNPFRYNGQYTDEESGLIYLRNRYYDPEIGRFISEDPYWNVNNMIYGNREYEEDEIKTPDYSAIVQSANLYVYCMNDPVNLADLFGTVAGEHFATPDEAAIDWAWNYYDVSLVTMLEHAALIYYSYDENGNKYYSYTNTMPGSPNNVKINELDKYIDDGKYCVGAVHSHTVTNELSVDDFRLAVDQGYAVLYVVGESRYSDGVDICKVQNYYDGNGYQYQAVASDLSYRRLSLNEMNNVIHNNDTYKHLINLWYDQIEYNYYLRSIRGY